MNTLQIPKLAKNALLSCLVFFLFLYGNDLHSQSNSFISGGYQIDHYGLKDGIENFDVTGIIQSRNGLIWMSNMSSLVKFDGYEFTIYKPEPDTGIVGFQNDFNFLHEDAQGNIWGSTWGGGLLKFDPRTETFTRLLTSEPYNRKGDFISTLTSDKAGNIWAGLRKGGIRLTLQKDSLIIKDFSAEGRVFKGSRGEIWLCGAGTLEVTYNPEREAPDFNDFSSFIAPFTSGNWNVEWMTQGPEGKWYLAVIDRLENGSFLPLVGILDPEVSSFTPIKHGLQDNVGINVMEYDPDGNLWLGTWGAGLYGLSPPFLPLNSIDEPDLTYLSLSEISTEGQAVFIRSFMLDKVGNLWVADRRNQAFKIKLRSSAKMKYTELAHLTGNRRDNFNFILADKTGDIWIAASSGGVIRFNPEDQKAELLNTAITGSANDNLIPLLEGENGQLWLGTKDGLISYNKNTGTRVNYPIPAAVKFSPAPEVVKQMISSQNDPNLYWILTTHFHVYQFDKSKGQYSSYYQRESNSDSKTFIYKMDKAKNGEVLYVKGMGQVGRMTDLNQSDESKLLINHNSPFFSMLADQQGRLWVSTLLGLSVYDENYNLIKNYTRADGLFDHLILSILEDKAGGIWVFTRNGANRFESQSEQFISFGYLDDLEIYPYSGLTTTVDEEGVVYVLGSKGVYAFFPERIEPDTIPPALIFTDFRVNNQAVNHSDSAVLKQTITYTDRVKLTYQQRNIAIEYAGIQNVANKIQYAYQLEGFDSDWIMAGNERVARYSNLPPGNYTFLVKAANADGAWMEEPARLGIRVRPPWWATIWAKAFYILLALALLIWFVQFQRAKVKAKQRELEREQELARQLEATNKRLAQMDKLKDQFLANTSHELRTPLTGIIGLSESLLDREEDLKKTQDLSMIISSGKRLASLVNDILDFSKLKNQELVLQKRPVDIHAAVEIVLALSQPLVKNKNLQLINQVPRDLALAEADENRVLQIFHNLIGNAIKFTEQGTVSVSAKEQDGLLEITVADTGIGIPEANLESIFKSFEQGDGSVAREYGGTGLGLSVSRQLIELHGGTITVASKVGIGTWFTFTLPVSEVEREAVDMLDQPLTAPDTIIKPEPEEPVVREPVPIPVRDGKPVKRMAFDDTIHILIVDDEPVNLQVLDNHLSLAGYEVSTANSGFEAMELIAQGRKFDLVVLDVMMPRMSGYEVCRKIRESYLTSELPVLMLTAKNRASDLVQGFNIGANDYLTKPFSKSELLSRIRTHLHLNRINRATSKFVPHAFLRSIGREAITDVKLGDQAHQLVTVFFSDIRDYTSLSEQMTPEENFNFVNAYVGRMGPVIQKNRGFVNQYLGDAIMALFPPAADHALEASIAMQHLIQQYNQERIGQDRQPIKVGMGLHTGHLMMGIIGDNNRSEPATIADTVNIASRMEGLTKIYGANILLSEDSISRISNSEKFHFRSIGKVQLKGKKAPISIYECFDGDDPELKTFKLESLDQFEKGLKFFFNREFGQAQVAFNQIIKQNDGDQVAAYFHKRAARYAYEGVPEDWTGIEKMTMK